MAKRGGTSGRDKRGGDARLDRRDSQAWQRRVDRDHGGPPSHVIAHQAAVRKRCAKELARSRAVVSNAARADRGIDRVVNAPHVVPPGRTINTGTPSVPVVLPVPGVWLRSPSLVRSKEAQSQEPSPPARKRAARLAVTAIAGSAAVVSLIVALAPPALPPPPITTPMSTLVVPLRTDIAIRQRILEMTPHIRLAQNEPAYPGSIHFAALSLPTAPPHIEAIVAPSRAPVVEIMLPRRQYALPGVPPDVSAVAVAAVPSVAAAPLTQPVPPVSLEPPVVTAALVPPSRPDRTSRADTDPANRPADPIVPRAPQFSNDAEAVSGSASAQAQCHAPAPEPNAIAALEPPAPESLGLALAAAAFDQVHRFVVYDARYTRIAFPGGDVATMHGVCTDVVIRAYRALGIDLQRIVYESRVGIGDTSIDHRRTETLRRFFAGHGETLPATLFAEDYEPGDIVTYYRPQNRISTAHIAIVSDKIGPSGRPMIIHNRGNGIQLEDALFVDRVTGHYRYAGPKQPLSPVAVTRGVPASRVTVITAGANAGVNAGVPRAVTVVRAAARSPAAHKLAIRTGGAVVTPSPAQISRLATAPSMITRPLGKAP